jgi:hypothetical protein
MSISPSRYNDLEINKILEDQKIITFFAIDTKTKSIVIEFNHNTTQKPKKLLDQ